jgi:uncharacterized protein (TIGR03083 family)
VGDEIDYAAIYRGIRVRVVDLVTGASDEQLEARAPATPEWRVRDVLGHLVGVTDDILRGNLDGVTTDAWTAAQVDARHDRSIAEVIAEWEENGPRVEPTIASWGVIAGQFIGDATTHEMDIRGALGRPGARDSDALALTYGWMGRRIGEMRTAGGAGALAVETESGVDTFGDGDSSARCRTSRFELVRAATGRRSVTQIEAWSWDGDPRPDLLVLPIFTPRADALIE